MRRLRNAEVLLPADTEAGWREYRRRHHLWEFSRIAPLAFKIFKLAVEFQTEAQAHAGGQGRTPSETEPEQNKLGQAHSHGLEPDPLDSPAPGSAHAGGGAGWGPTRLMVKI
jgi:hypothetical protein